MELREYLRACRRRWAWIVVPVLLAVGITAGLTLSAAPAYKSSMVLFVTTGANDPDQGISRLNSYIALLTGPRVADTVIAQLKLPETTKEVQKKITAEVQSGTDLLVVSATDPSAALSRDIVTTATSTLVALAKQLDPPNAAATANGATPASISIAQEAVTARQPNGLVRNGGFSAALGLLIGAAAVAIRESTRKTVTEERDLRRLGIGTVGVISLGGRSGRSGVGYEALAEGFRRLRSLLPEPASLSAGSPRGRSLLLTASNPDEGTTAVACGLAIAMAETGSRVVLVDANLRTPGVGRYLSMDTSHGLADVLAGTADVSDVLQDSLDGRLTVLPSGQQLPDPGEILASPTLGATVRDLTERFDVVLVDAPSLHAVADATVLSKVTDSALLVVRAGRTRTADVERSTDLLERVGAQLAGAVLNALPRKLPTSSSWNRVGLMGPSFDPELVTGLLGDDPADRTDDPDNDEPDEAPIWRQPRTDIVPARGRARVVNGTVTTGRDEDDEDDPATEWAGGTPARGQARVVIITDAQPPATSGPAAPAPAPAADPESASAPDDEPADAPHLPSQRDPNAKPQPGE
jgi:capsular exopolysaccharide synthesis family protein